MTKIIKVGIGMVCGETLKKIICVGTGIVCGDKYFVRNIEIIST